MVFKQLNARRFSVGQISSDLEQSEREQVMLDFRNRKVDILVATDVLSRGIDVDGIDMVINYDVPRDAEDYVHRIGRTARAERKGAALTLISPVDSLRFKRIEALIGKPVDRLPLPEHLAAEAAKMKEEPRKSTGPAGRGGRPGNTGRSKTGPKKK